MLVGFLQQPVLFYFLGGLVGFLQLIWANRCFATVFSCSLLYTLELVVYSECTWNLWFLPFFFID